MKLPNLWTIAVGGMVLTTGVAAILVLNPPAPPPASVVHPDAGLTLNPRQPVPSESVPQTGDSMPEPTAGGLPTPTRLSVSEPTPTAAASTTTSATQTAGPVGGADGQPILISPEWLQTMSGKTGVTQEALRAYAIAEIRAKRDKPGCRLAWNTLAGIGYVESQHGTIGGRTVLPDGRESSPIYGPVLDGGQFAAIKDTDDGRLDGDSKWDRAVGPMQFIPSTWSKFAKDANADGATDPQNIEDAALTAAEYLCYKGGDLTTAAGWTDSIMSYNHSTEYVRSVLTAANKYAAQSHN